MRWEHRVVNASGIPMLGGPTKPEELQEQLFKLGNEGWELVSVALVQTT